MRYGLMSSMIMAEMNACIHTAVICSHLAVRTGSVHFHLCLHSGACLPELLDAVNGVEEALVRSEGIPRRSRPEKGPIQRRSDG